MCRVISSIKVQQTFALPEALKNVVSTLQYKPEVKTNNQSELNTVQMAQAIRLAEVEEKQDKIPTIKEVLKDFYSGKLDPRKVGELSFKVQGRDDGVHIYVGKNKKGEDCVCLDFRKKHTECNIYSTLHIKIQFKKYDKQVAEYNEKHTQKKF